MFFQILKISLHRIFLEITLIAQFFHGKHFKKKIIKNDRQGWKLSMTVTEKKDTKPKNSVKWP
jgi:hypothetical protein